MHYFQWATCSRNRNRVVSDSRVLSLRNNQSPDPCVYNILSLYLLILGTLIEYIQPCVPYAQIKITILLACYIAVHFK